MSPLAESGDGASFNGALQVVDGSQLQRQKENTPRNEIHSTMQSNAVRNQGTHVSRPTFVTPPPWTHWGMVRFPIPGAQPNQGGKLSGDPCNGSIPGSRLTSTVGSCRAWLCPTFSPASPHLPHHQPSSLVRLFALFSRHQEQERGPERGWATWGCWRPSSRHPFPMTTLSCARREVCSVH